MTLPLETRAERKDRTHRAILDAALDLTRDSTLAAVSLRQVAKEAGIVPTAFYKHFDSVEQLGEELVVESFDALRELLRTARDLPDAAPGAIVDSSVAVLVSHVSANASHYRFLARERAAGPPAVREAIRHQLDLATRDLATDLALLPATRGWNGSDLRSFASLLVGVMIGHAETIASATSERELASVAAEARTHLRMALVGAANWRSLP